ncbi:Motile sperm domain-containing protein 2-like protein [Leptotrombidium deliense]|uniref:Motile sperm domain-containing protein 2-like protein n=1 Tax=Leptotrombidium deliense TaxID=299467 RepID=A0A443SMV0_9ACAR|nr:Motile sperm domain-containing protein 2-like protein [Leptotrombidium deliense]
MLMKIDAMAVEKGEEFGYTVVFDLTGVTLSNYDLPELVFVIDFFCRYMSSSLKHVLVNNLPWYFKPFVSIALSFVPQEWKQVIKFMGKNDIFKYIEKKHVPKFLGGTCEQSHKAVPQGCRSVREIAKEQFDVYNVTDEKVVKLLKSYEKMFEED